MKNLKEKHRRGGKLCQKGNSYLLMIEILFFLSENNLIGGTKCQSLELLMKM